MREFWTELGMQERYFVAGTGAIVAAIVLMFSTLEPHTNAPTDAENRAAVIERNHR